MDKFEMEQFGLIRDVVADLQTCFIDGDAYSRTPSAREWRRGSALVHRLTLLCFELHGYASATRQYHVADIRERLHIEGGEKQKENPDAGTSGESARLGFVEFTEKEILQMPKNIKRLIIIDGKRCRLRTRKTGNNSFTYQIRFRCDGYEINAGGKTIALAKENFIRKAKTAQPKKTPVETTIPTTFHSFAMYYFENFRKEKVTPLTYRIDLIRYANHLKDFFEEKPLEKITPMDCKTILQDLKNDGKGKTADEVYALLSVIFRAAINHGVLSRNPLVMVSHTAHVRENGTALTKEEESQLFDFLINEPLYALPAALMLYCGLRPNELQTAVIDGDFIKAVNSKRKSKHVEYKRIPIINRLRPYLPKDGAFKIPTLDILRRRIRAALPGHKLYDLRTTFYSRCKEYDVSEHALKHFAGHSLGKIGNAYTDLSDEYLLSEGRKLNKW